VLQNLRDQSGNWFFKFILITIAASFFIFGIGDMIRGIFSHQSVAVVGNKDISMAELDAEVRHEFRRIQVERQGSITLEELIKIGFVDKILERIINRTVLTQEMERLQLTASENVIRNNIQSMEPFMENGRFDHEKFQSILKNAGLNQKGLVGNMRRQIIERQYFLSFAHAGVQSQYYRNILIDAMLQKRDFSIVTINANEMTVDKKLSDQEISDFFEAHKTNYTIEETRDIAIVHLDLKQLSKNINVSGEELNAAYHNKKHLYFSPETRHIQKTIFSTEDAAQKAYSLLEQKKDFKTIVKNLKEAKTIDLGEITKNILPESDQETVFDLKKGEHTGIIADSDKFIIYEVISINNEKQQSFEEVRAELLDTVRLEKFQEDYKAIKDKIEDELAGGNALENIAHSMKLPLLNINNLTKDGAALDNPEYKTLLPLKEQILDQAYKLDADHTSPVLDITTHDSFILSVKKISAQHIPIFSDVKEKVINDALNYLKMVKAAEVAQKIAKKAENSATLTKLVKEYKVTMTTNHIYSRMSIIDNADLREQLMADAVERAFSVPLNQAIAGRAKKGFVVIVPTKDLEISTEERKKSEDLIKRMDEMITESMIDLLINNMKHHHPIKINSDNLNKFISMISKSEG
jgi:peptidyl-prolyl cis-trans isomerase D